MKRLVCATGAGALATAVLLAGASCSSSSPRAQPPALDSSVDGTPEETGHPETGDTETGPTDAGAGLTCGRLLSCDQSCTTGACTSACYAEATAHAQGLFDNFTACIAEQCASGDGGQCSSPSSMECSQCRTSAATGACVTFLASCEDDTQQGPPDPDGSAQVIDAGDHDAGPLVSCGMLLSCDQACAAGDTSCLMQCYGDGTATAQALDTALLDCVAGACPGTDGGPCSDAGSACMGCVEQSYYAECMGPFTACENDRSAMPDGGTEPVALQGGTINVLASNLSQPQAVLIQGGEAYFSEITSTGPVLKVPVDGGATATISPSQPFPMGLAIDANNIYVWNSGSFSGSNTVNNGDGTVVQIPLSGSAPITLATNMVVAFAAPYLNAITVDGANVYWVSGGPGTAGAINAAPIGGGSPARVLYPSQVFPEAVVTDGTNLYWSNWGTFDAQGNYNGDGAILKAPVGGGSPTTLASSQLAPSALAIDSRNVYWTNTGQLTPGGLAEADTGATMQVAIAGGNPITLAPNQNIGMGIAVVANTLYWTEYGFSSPGDIKSVPVGGGTVTTLVANAQDPFGLAVSGSVIYWTKNIPTGSNGALYSLTP